MIPDPAAARAQFAAFPPALQAAMKAAGAAERWTSAFWVEETGLAAELLDRSGFDPEFAAALAGWYAAIRTPPAPRPHRAAANAP